jgi:hypothetical protein
MTSQKQKKFWSHENISNEEVKLEKFYISVLWRAGYTPDDRQTSWGVLHHTAQYLYSACI